MRRGTRTDGCPQAPSFLTVTHFGEFLYRQKGGSSAPFRNTTGIRHFFTMEALAPGKAAIGSVEIDMRWMLITERVLAVVVTAFIGLYASSCILRGICSQAAVQSFENKRLDSALNTPEFIAAPHGFGPWSQKRIKECQKSLDCYVAPAIGIRRPAKVHIEAPILNRTDDLALYRGVGHITGTSKVGEGGNIGMAGQRFAPSVPSCTSSHSSDCSGDCQAADRHRHSIDAF